MKIEGLEVGYEYSIFKFGYLGVDLFFIISGYVIFNNLNSHNSLSFLKSQFLSIYPTFFIFLHLTLILKIFFTDYNFKLIEYLLNLFFLPEVFNYNYIDGVYWSLFFEVFFYFFILI